MTMAEKRALFVAQFPGSYALLFGTAPGAECTSAVNGNGYACGYFRDGSALGVLACGYVYANISAADRDDLDTIASVGRLLAGLPANVRAAQGRESGTQVAPGYFRLGATVWHIPNEHVCNFAGLWRTWQAPRAA